MPSPIELTRWEPLLRWIVGEFYPPPGLDRQDLMQEARIGLLEALRDYRPEAGSSLKSFIVLCAHRKIHTALRSATRHKHGPLNHSVRALTDEEGVEHQAVDLLPAGPEVDPAAIVAAREELRELTERAGELTEFERTAFGHVASGRPYSELGPHKRVDNAVQRARRKLRGEPRPRAPRAVEQTRRRREPMPAVELPAAIDREIAATDQEITELRERLTQRQGYLATLREFAERINGDAAAPATAPNLLPRKPNAPKPRKAAGRTSRQHAAGAERTKAIIALARRRGKIAASDVVEAGITPSPSAARKALLRLCQANAGSQSRKLLQAAGERPRSGGGRRERLYAPVEADQTAPDHDGARTAPERRIVAAIREAGGSLDEGTLAFQSGGLSLTDCRTHIAGLIRRGVLTKREIEGTTLVELAGGAA